MNMTKYDAALAAWAREEGLAAEHARSQGDERALSLAQMKKNMCETMLPALGHKAPDRLPACAQEMARRAEDFRARGDYDSADRCLVQREVILRAWSVLSEGSEAQ